MEAKPSLHGAASYDTPQMRHIKKMSALTSDVRRFVALNPRAVTICLVSFRPSVSSSLVFVVVTARFHQLVLH